MLRAMLHKLIVYQESNGYMTIREAVYNAEGQLEVLGATPAFPRGLSVDDLQKELEEFMNALDRTVVFEDDLEVDDDDVDLEDFDVDEELPN